VIRSLTFVSLLLGLVFAVAFFLLENPNHFKSQISEAIESATGYEVTIEGELSWRYWPPIAINAEQVRLGIPGASPFIKLDQVSIDIDLLPLITQQRVVDVDKIAITGGSVLLLVDGSGKSNWELTATGKPPGENHSGSDEIVQTSTLQRFLVENLEVSYIDEQADLDYDMVLTKFSTSALTSDRPFDISLIVKIQNNFEDLTALIKSTGQLQYSAANNHFGFDDLITTITLVVDHEPYPEINLASKGQWRPSQDAIVLTRNDIRVSSANIVSSGVINLSGDTPTYDGVINFQTADPSKLSRDFDIELPVKFLQFSADVALDPALIHMRALEGEFDESKFKGTATLALPSINTITADLRIDKLDTTDYWSDSPVTDSKGLSDTATKPAVPTDSELIPVRLLRHTHLKTIIRIDSLTGFGGDLRNAKVELRNDRKVLDLIANASGYNGRIVFSANTQLTGEMSTDVQLTLDRLDISKLAEVEGVTGSLTANSNLKFDGSMLSQLHGTLVGKSTFVIKDGTLDVRPLKAVAKTIDSITRKTSSVSDWPDTMPFDSMAGNHVFTDGIETGQVFNASMKNISITALGGLSLQAETLSYDVTTTLKKTETGEFKISKQLSGIRWPLICSGKFSDSPVDLCLGKDGAISQLVTQVVKQDLQRRGSEKIEELINENLPDEYKDITTKLFKNLFKKK
jgi:AsmA protein